MKKLILTSMLAAVGLFAQTNTPAASQKSNPTPAPAAQTPAQASQTPAKTAKHKHKKATNSGSSTAVKPDTTGNSSTAPANPAPANKK